MENKGKILIVDDVHPLLIEGLKDLNWQVDYFPDIQVTKIKEILSTYQGLILRSKIWVDKSIIDLGSSLKFIARAGAGMENIDEDYAIGKGIICHNAPEGNRDAVADHVLMLMLGLLRNIKKSILELGQGIWNREGNRGKELSEMIVGIIGFGNNGEAFSKRLEGFRCKVLVFDKYKKIQESDYIKQVGMNEIFENADILTLHIPLTEETKYLVDKEFIRKFKKNIYLVNASRGKICKENDLFDLLIEKKILGLALDVLEKENFNELNSDEKLSLKKLLGEGNVIITPHIAGWTIESYNKISKVLLEKIRLMS